ncbi:MAG: C25 family cysteine peptidase [Phycisphaerales bacterium]
MKLLLAPLLAAVALFSGGAASPTTVALPRFIAIGGGLRDDNTAAYDALLTRRDTGKIVIVPYASADAAAAAASATERFKKFRPDARYLILPDAAKDAESRTLAADWIAHADLVYFTGGDQSRLIPRFYTSEGKPNEVLRALNDGMLKWGTLVGGTSAGCACLTDPMFTGGGSESALADAPANDGEGPAQGRRGVQLGRGLGLVREIILDSHFISRGRTGRMVAALEKSGKRVGIGVADNRAVHCDGRTFRAIGDTAALVVDICDLKREGLGRTGVRLSLLSDGDRCILGDQGAPDEVAFAILGAAVPKLEAAAALSADIKPDAKAWERNVLLAMLRRLAADPATPQRALTDRFEVTLSADPRTRFHARAADPATLSVVEAGLDIRERPQTRPAAAEPARARPSFLVVAPRTFVPALGEYLATRNAEMRTEILPLEDALAEQPGADDPEKLKRCLYVRWNEGLRYVLLVGDADVMPIRYMVLDRVTEPAFDYAFYPSDLYYADVAKPDGSFDDWNAARDGFHAHYYGEVRGEKNKTGPINFDAIDYKPELALGRWPVSTPEQARAVAAKTLAHDRALAHPSSGTGVPPATPRVATVVTAGWVDARDQLDRAATRLKGWSTRRRYYKDANPAFDTPPPTDSEVIALINAGAGLILHAGHGSDDRWDGSLSIASIPALKNGPALPILFSAGCSTARFATLPPYEAYEDAAGSSHKGTNHGEVFKEPPPPPACYARGPHNKSGLGEELLRADTHGAIAYIGCNTGSQPCGLTLLDGFVDHLADNPGARIGDCWAGAVSRYYDREHLATIIPTESWYPASIFFQGMKFMLFGDPTARTPR